MLYFHSSSVGAQKIAYSKSRTVLVSNFFHPKFVKKKLLSVRLIDNFFSPYRKKNSTQMFRLFCFSGSAFIFERCYWYWWEISEEGKHRLESRSVELSRRVFPVWSHFKDYGWNQQSAS